MVDTSDPVSERRRFDNCFQNRRSSVLSCSLVGIKPRFAVPAREGDKCQIGFELASLCSPLVGIFDDIAKGVGMGRLTRSVRDGVSGGSGPCNGIITTVASRWLLFCVVLSDEGGVTECWAKPF